MSTMTVEDLRREIDEVDAGLVALIARRCELSRTIQSLRLAQGGPRVVQAREAEVVGRWRAALGAPGTRIAMLLLELGRGA
jgi:chorismate mutase